MGLMLQIKFVIVNFILESQKAQNCPGNKPCHTQAQSSRDPDRVYTIGFLVLSKAGHIIKTILSLVVS